MQRVVINGSYSNRNPVKSSVLQGSLLGPTLFVMYTNDLPNVIMHSKPFFFFGGGGGVRERDLGLHIRRGRGI